MLNRNARRHLDSITVAYLDDRDDELLDAVVTAAALVARADNWISRSSTLSYSTFSTGTRSYRSRRAPRSRKLSRGVFGRCESLKVRRQR